MPTATKKYVAGWVGGWMKGRADSRFKDEQLFRISLGSYEIWNSKTFDCHYLTFYEIDPKFPFVTFS